MKYQELGTSGIMVSKVSLGAWGLGGGSVWSDKTSTVADTMVVRDEKTGRILLIQQYGRPSCVLVAGYVNRGEQARENIRPGSLAEEFLNAYLDERGIS